MAHELRVLAVMLGLLSPPLAAAQSGIDGTIKNGTVGGPGKADRVNLIRLAEGMSQVASLAGAEGSFHFDLKDPGPYLVQVQYGGVTYNVMVPPTERGVATPEITVYEPTGETGALEVSIPHYIVIVDGPKLHISRVFEATNRTAPPRSITGDPGVLRFDLPDDAEAVVGQITSARMPIRQDPIETRDGRGKTMAYGLKPGLTRYELEHEVAYGGEIELKETLYHGAQSFQLIVVPAEVTVEAPELTAAGRAEKQGVSFLSFSGANLPPGKVLSIRIRGNASAPQAPQGAGGEAAGADSMSGAGDATTTGSSQGVPKEVEVASVRGVRKWILFASSFAFLVGALVVGLRKPRSGPTLEETRRRVTARAETLLESLAALDDALEQGTMEEVEHRERRVALKRTLTDELATARRRKKTA